MHRSLECSTMPSSVGKMHVTGQTAAQGASVQCMQAIETERSPGLPSLIVTTRRRLIPQGTSFSFLQAVTQALQSMHRSASQRNFMRAIAFALSCCSYLAKGCLRLLHAGRRIVAIGRERIHALAEHDRIGAWRIFGAPIGTLVPAGEMKRHPSDTSADPLGNERLHAGSRVALWAGHPDPCAVFNAAFACVRWIDFDEHVLLQLGEPFVGAGFLATALILHEPARTQDQRELFGETP